MVYFFCAFFFLCYLCYVKNESNQLCEHENYDVHGSTLSAMLRGLYAAKGYS